GDVPLTIFQSLPLDGVIIVTTPQDLVSLIVENHSQWLSRWRSRYWVSLRT
ncbi:MAG: P-loop NTPase, partial [Erysipelotrichaceae bacterium]|nr:P-loop NTPase [Erysipelotrichaceae bacterium]